MRSPAEDGKGLHAEQGPCLQMDELERGQILERGTVSLPSMHNFRQELLKAPTFASASGGDLATWRRPANTGSGEAPVSRSGTLLLHCPQTSTIVGWGKARRVGTPSRA